jgi:nucleoid-associated protein EbfC
MFKNLGNIGQLMKQAQAMQEKMAKAQEELKDISVTGTSGGGLVTVTMNGKGEAQAVKIDPKILSAEDKEMLEDLVTAAFNDAKHKVDQTASEKMGDISGGLNLPAGFKLPF